MGATNSWKCQDNFVNQTVCYIFYSNMDTRTLGKNFVRYTHLNLLHEHNVIYAKGKRILYLFGRSFDDSNDDDLNSTNLSKTRRKSGSFRIQLQFAPSGVDPASLARAGSRVAVVDSSNLPSAVVLSYTLVRSNGRSGGKERKSL